MLNLDAIADRIVAIDTELRRRLRGGLQFGMDWPTVTALFPELAGEYRRLLREGREQIDGPSLEC